MYKGEHHRLTWSVQAQTRTHNNEIYEKKMEGVFMENLGYLLEDDDISPAVKRRSRTQTAASAQLENVSKKYLFVKRLADVVLSFLAVIVLSVPMLLIALAVFLPIRFGAPAMFYAEPALRCRCSYVSGSRVRFFPRRTLLLSLQSGPASDAAYSPIFCGQFRFPAQ